MKNDRNVFRVRSCLYESSLERIYQHVYRGFVIISANQGRDEETEEKAHNELKGQVKELNAGFIELIGKWIDEKDKEYWEKLLFVPYPGEKWGIFKDFLSKMLELAKSHNQEAIIYGDGEKIHLAYRDGKIEDLGDFHPDRLSTGYSKIAKSRYKGRVFVFEGVRIPRSPFEAFVMQKSGYLIEGKFFFELK